MKHASGMPESYSYKDRQIHQVFCNTRLNHYPKHMINNH